MTKHSVLQKALVVALAVTYASVLVAAENTPQRKPAAVAASRGGNTNGSANPCTRGAVIGGAVAVGTAAILDVMGGGGLATTLTVKVLLGAAIAGCLGDSLHSAFSQQPSSAVPVSNTDSAHRIAP